jgi:RNA polymerase sigma-70 factor (ECF subfamily)
MAELTELDEAAELLYRAAAGSADAFRAFADLYLDELSAYADRHGVEDPELAASNAIWGLIERIDSFGGTRAEQIRSYLFRSVRNRAIDERRRSERRGPVTTIDVIDLVDTAAGDGIVARDCSESVVDTVLVDSLLEHVTPAQREVLELRYLEDLTLAETAERTGRTVQATAQLQQRALRVLRAAVVGTLVIGLVVGGLIGWMRRSAPVVTEHREQPTVVTPIDGEGGNGDSEIGGPADEILEQFSPEVPSQRVIDVGAGLRMVMGDGTSVIVFPGATIRVTSDATLPEDRAVGTTAEPPTEPDTCAAEVGAPDLAALHYPCHPDGSPTDPELFWPSWDALMSGASTP